MGPVAPPGAGKKMACCVENALALAVFAGLADVLPYIGALLSVAPAVLAALARGPVVAVVVLVHMLAYEEFESRVLVPRIYGRGCAFPRPSSCSRCWPAVR
jgi:predicted PurR-regulated permease PerM